MLGATETSCFPRVNGAFSSSSMIRSATLTASFAFATSSSR